MTKIIFKTINRTVSEDKMHLKTENLKQKSNQFLPKKVLESQVEAVKGTAKQTDCQLEAKTKNQEKEK